MVSIIDSCAKVNREHSKLSYEYSDIVANIVTKVFAKDNERSTQWIRESIWVRRKGGTNYKRKLLLHVDEGPMMIGIFMIRWSRLRHQMLKSQRQNQDQRSQQFEKTPCLVWSIIAKKSKFRLFKRSLIYLLVRVVGLAFWLSLYNTDCDLYLYYIYWGGRSMSDQQINTCSFTRGNWKSRGSPQLQL